MDNYGGDLADIIRTGGTINASTIDILPPVESDYDQHHQIDHNRQIDQYRLGLDLEDPLDEFGDPFSLLLQDPLITSTHDDDTSNFFNNNVVDHQDNSSTLLDDQNGRRLFISATTEEQDSIIRRPSSISINNNNSFFTRMFDQHVDASNSTKSSPTLVKTTTNPLLVVNDVVINNNSINGGGGGVQISSPRNTGIKRRKSQTKKVVCIPAPAPVNSRPSGEVVPSDLWAWRKYGQKPIKGSPYPRGYYRCSSCKGCPARKQVERNRTDPNMLVITYTCEHNHPWPTQRNALAGSTRTTHPSRSGSGSNSKITPTNSSPNSQSTHKQPNNKHLQITINHDKSSSPPGISSVKEEMEMEMDMDDHVRFSQVFQQSAYKPGFVDESSHGDDFFAELGELEADPMNILFPNGYSEVDDCENKSLDPFTFYDWAGNNNKNNNNINNKDYLVRPEENKGS